MGEQNEGEELCLDVRKCLIDDDSLNDTDVVITRWHGCVGTVAMSVWKISDFSLRRNAFQRPFNLLYDCRPFR